MSLIDEARAEVRGQGGTCETGQWLAGLSTKDRAEVDEAMRAEGLQHTALYRAVKKRWPDVPGFSSFTRHRKQECSCGAR